MYKLKQLPEDFIVKEINDIKPDNNGNYSYFSLKKKNYNTLSAIKLVSQKLKINTKNIGFSGNKDKNAVTEQIISIKNGKKDFENLILNDIELKYIGNGNKEVFLGSHKGNEFVIIIRNLIEKEIKNIENKIKNNEILMPNYFGEQRLSGNNAEIGRALVKKDFKKAVELIIESNSDFRNDIIEHLSRQRNDYVVALKKIPIKMLKFYIHAYQSWIFNESLKEMLKKESKIKELPLVGFGTKSNKVVRDILAKENIGPRDFIIRQIPELSSEGDERKAFIRINDFKITKKEKDELNEGKEKLTVRFSLPKGCYATVLVDFLFKN